MNGNIFHNVAVRYHGEGMKLLYKILSALSVAAIVLCCAACDGGSGNQLKHIERPDTAATTDEAVDATAAVNAVEESDNVNGMRFNLSLRGFSLKYNTIITGKPNVNLLLDKNWQKVEGTAADDNGVEVQYWYYDDENVSFTATEEVESGKLLNIGIGTTMSKFMGVTDGVNNSDLILQQAAWMAEAACGFSADSEAVLEDIFFRTTTENKDTLWYQGYVFHLNTKEDKTDAKSSIMQFRVFPITDALQKEWKLEKYTL